MAEKNVILKNTAGDVLYPEVAVKNRVMTVDVNINMLDAPDTAELYSISGNFSSETYESLVTHIKNGGQAFFHITCIDFGMSNSDTYNVPMYISTDDEETNIQGDFILDAFYAVQVEEATYERSEVMAPTLFRIYTYDTHEEAGASISLTTTPLNILTDNIADKAVTEAKISDNAVTVNKISKDFSQSLFNLFNYATDYAFTDYTTEPVNISFNDEKEITLKPYVYNVVTFRPNRKEPTSSFSILVNLQNYSSQDIRKGELIRQLNTNLNSSYKAPTQGSIESPLIRSYSSDNTSVLYEGCFDTFDIEVSLNFVTSSSPIIWNTTPTKLSKWTHYEFKIRGFKYYGSNNYIYFGEISSRSTAIDTPDVMIIGDDTITTAGVTNYRIETSHPYITRVDAETNSSTNYNVSGNLEKGIKVYVPSRPTSDEILTIDVYYTNSAGAENVIHKNITILGKGASEKDQL